VKRAEGKYFDFLNREETKQKIKETSTFLRSIEQVKKPE